MLSINLLIALVVGVSCLMSSWPQLMALQVRETANYIFSKLPDSLSPIQFSGEFNMVGNFISLFQVSIQNQGANYPACSVVSPNGQLHELLKSTSLHCSSIHPGTQELPQSERSSKICGKGADELINYYSSPELLDGGIPAIYPALITRAQAISKEHKQLVVLGWQVPHVHRLLMRHADGQGNSTEIADNVNQLKEAFNEVVGKNLLSRPFENKLFIFLQKYFVTLAGEKFNMEKFVKDYMEFVYTPAHQEGM